MPVAIAPCTESVAVELTVSPEMKPSADAAATRRPTATASPATRTLVLAPVARSSATRERPCSWRHGYASSRVRPLRRGLCR